MDKSLSKTIPCGIEPSDARCSVCGDVFKAIMSNRTINGKSMEPMMIEADDQCMIHEFRVHGGPVD